MKALTLTEPWATLMKIGAKHFETRSFQVKYRGPLAIHAAKTMPRYAKEFIAHNRSCHEALQDNDIRVGALARPENWLPMGKVIAVCDLVACVQVNERTKREGAWIESSPVPYHIILPPNPPELEFGDYSDGRFVWITENLRVLREPIPAKGSLGLWEWTPPARIILP